jgi:hypothetical protein
MQKHVIEYAGVPVGIVVPFEEYLQFVAVKFHVIGLDGQRFRSLTDVRRAVHVHVASQNLAAA